jgi:hypothetical protein
MDQSPEVHWPVQNGFLDIEKSAFNVAIWLVHMRHQLVRMRAGGAVTTGVLRRLFSPLTRMSAGFLDPELTPSCRTDVAINECARIRLLEERAGKHRAGSAFSSREL